MLELWFCQDCTAIACNGGGTLKHYKRALPNFDSNADADSGLEGFSRRRCDACGDTDAGYRARFALPRK